MPAVLTCAMMARDVYESEGSTILGYHAVPPDPPCNRCNHSASSFFGRAYRAGDVGVIAFRGSQELKDWTDADVGIAQRMLPGDQLGDTFAFLSAARAQLEELGCKRFVVVGHSLGGGLAAVVAARITRWPLSGATFNAPGLGSFSRLYGEAEAMDTIAKGLGAVAGIAMRSVSAGLAATNAYRKVRGIPEASVHLNLPRDNARNVINVRAHLDPVSLHGQHIGRVVTIRNAGTHAIGPLVDALLEDPAGGMRV